MQRTIAKYVRFYRAPNLRVNWINKTDGAKLSAKPPTLKSLPHTDEALELNTKRAHFGVAM